MRPVSSLCELSMHLGLRSYYMRSVAGTSSAEDFMELQTSWHSEYVDEVRKKYRPSSPQATLNIEMLGEGFKEESALADSAR